MPSRTVQMPHLGEPILSLRSISKSFGRVKAVQDVSLEIPRGSIYGFLGPNGAGKTTTIRCIMNIILPDSGEVLFAGQPLSGALRDRIGYLPEERGLYRKMKVSDQLAYLAELKSVPRREAAKRAEEWLERLDLAKWSQHKTDALSKGMQQKIQFAATFIFYPDLVILDEPFAGLDPLNIELLREIILFEKQKGTTIIFSTHMLTEAEKICDAIFLIEGGEKILDGSLDEVRQEFPFHSIHVAFADGREPPADLPQVTQRKFEEGTWRLTLAAGEESQRLLDRLVQVGPVSYFSANRPSLSEIFLTAVKRRRSEQDSDTAMNSTSASVMKG